MLRRKLNKLVVPESNLHEILKPGVPLEIEVIKGENLLLKVALKDMLPPLTLSVRYSKGQKPDLTLIISCDNR
jgi:hypothetical protein